MRRRTELGLALVVIGVPAVFFPLSTAPYADAKLVVLVAGALAVAGARPSVGAGRAALAGLWAVAVGLAAAGGVDPLWSLLGDENQAVGVATLWACALLVVAGGGLDEGLRDRIPRWLVGTCTVLAAAGVAQRFGLLPLPPPNAASATLGQPVVFGGLQAAGLAAAVALRLTPWTSVWLVVMASGLSLSDNRAGWLGAGLGLVVGLWRSGAGARRWAATLAIVGGTLAAWTAADAALTPAARLSAAAKFAEAGSGRQRLAVWPVCVRAWLKRPLFGSGPATTWGRFLSEARAPEIRRAASRGWGDCRDILLESAVTTGAVGTAALVALGGLAGWRLLRCDPPVGWAAGAAAALVPTHALQPLSVVLLPLGFLCAGVAWGPPKGRRIRLPVPAAFAVGVPLVALALLRFGASALEEYGRRYASAPALRAALRLEPWRVSAAASLARHRAVDWRMGEAAAAAEARAVARQAVRRHRWHPGVRLVAADVEVLLEQPARAERLVRRHLALFPNDPAALAGAATLALQRGDREEAARLARRSLAALPSRRARQVLDAATGRQTSR